MTYHNAMFFSLCVLCVLYLYYEEGGVSGSEKCYAWVVWGITEVLKGLFKMS